MHGEMRYTGSIGHRGAAVSELLSEDMLQFLYQFCAGYPDGEIYLKNSWHILKE